ncbi:hypothetical protein AAFP35_17815 [Gordonia sp. CPCC 206044]|uniref:hypothetical protein n=1 Tax=Gordonia sp. CPCC 206044 TaxID=3140793 RepID=UPI003AF367AB
MSTLPHRSDDAGLAEWRTHTLTEEAHACNDTLRRANSRVSGEWWSIPMPSHSVETTRALGSIGALQIVAEEDSSIGDEARVWPVTVGSAARIYEITSPTDLARLVTTYPLDVTESKRWDWFRAIGEHRRWFIPDWAAVAEDYDGVHVSVWGYLETAGIAVPIDDRGGAAVLAGWDPDATWWLNLDAIHIEDVPTQWRRDDQRWLQTR